MWFRQRLESVILVTQKVTDLLYKCYGQAILDDDREEDFEEILKVIKDRYDSIINGLELTISLDDEFKTIRENFSKRSGEITLLPEENI